MDAAPTIGSEICPPVQKRWRLVARKERWGLTWTGRALALGMAAGLALLLLAKAHPFLALTRPVHCSVLVVEGWMSSGELRNAATRFWADGYQMIYTTGGPLDDVEEELDSKETYAAYAAAQLCGWGIPKDQVQAAPSFVWRKDRSYSSAVALREWLKSHGKTVAGMNVATEGTHARRTLLLYQKVFADQIPIGVIAIPSRGYDPDRWWNYSEGVKSVISEGAAYLHEKLQLRKAD
jgi:hypothetical protein